MSRMAYLFGFAVFAIGFANGLDAQQIPDQYDSNAAGYNATSHSVPAHATQQYVPQSYGAQTYETHPVPYQQNSAQHCAMSHHQGSAGGCGCRSCSQEPSAFWTSYYRNTRWPAPFKVQDINAVTSYFAVQRENGWKMHNTVGHVLFDPQSNCLTEAGKNHIRSILTDNPLDRRAVFVLQGPSPQHTAQRVESVQLAISALLPTGDLPAIYITDRDAPGSSGAYQTAVTRAMMTSLPSPRLPAFNGSQSGP